jgi:hypothetical protein
MRVSGFKVDVTLQPNVELLSDSNSRDYKVSGFMTAGSTHFPFQPKLG